HDNGLVRKCVCECHLVDPDLGSLHVERFAALSLDPAPVIDETADHYPQTFQLSALKVRECLLRRSQVVLQRLHTGQKPFLFSGVLLRISLIGWTILTRYG